MAEKTSKPKTPARSRTPHSAEFLKYMASGWADRPTPAVEANQAAPWAKLRRAKVADEFAGKLVRIDAGSTKVRSNDTDYRFRPHSAFTHLTGWGSETVPDSVLLIEPDGSPVLYFRPTANRDSDEFFANPAIGEFWVGARAGLAEISHLLQIETRDLNELGNHPGLKTAIDMSNPELARFVSELRLVKDEFEIAQLRSAVAKSIKGFEAVVRALPTAMKSPRGERVLETAFFAVAREEGNELGYDTISAAGPHACILHWIINNGETRAGELVLLDAGVELETLYTADLTRTLPINGRYTELQKTLHEAVREAADAAFSVVKPGVKFREVHQAAMQVIAQKCADWGLLKVSAAESLEPDKQFHRRWMVHGTSHHLGLDVHDCAQARNEMYLDAELQPGMVFTIEPGLYFQPDDLLVPAEFRGIGIRIEDDILVTETGAENLSAALPRSANEIEKWMEQLAR